MRATALRGFCISVGKYAEAGDVVDVSESNHQFLHAIGALGPVLPEEVPAEEAADNAADTAPQTMQRKGAKAR